MEKTETAIIGGGPGGYMAALELARLSKTPVVFEKDALGGTCLNSGCIPTKALLASADILEKLKGAKDFGITGEYKADLAAAVKRKDRIVTRNVMGIAGMFKNNGIKVIPHQAKLLEGKIIQAGGETFAAENIIIATGSRPKRPPIDGIEHAMDSTQALGMTEVPGSIAIIGGGAIGAEFARLFHAFGSKVIIIEALDRMLYGFDKDISVALQKSFMGKGIKVYTSCRAEKITRAEKGLQIKIKTQEQEQLLHVDKCMIAAGREANVLDGTEKYRYKYESGILFCG